MRRSIVSLFSFLAIALIALTGCQEPQNTIPGSVDSISVRVMDSTDAKTITPEGNVNISHYIITVVNEAEGINQSSGYLTKGSMFTVSNVPAGTWYAKVDAYIDRGEDTYVKVASDQSEPKTVQAGASTTFELVLDTLDAVASGDVTVTLKMPAALSAESTAFWYQYTITGLTDEEFTHTSALLSGSTGADSLATITLDADAIGLMQGAYRFAIMVQDAETSPTLTKKGVDVMRLVNGLEAKGTIDLTTYEANQSFNMTITDKIGDILTPSLEDGKEVYNLDGQDGSASLTVTLAEPLKANETIEWYVDGELDETVNADEASSGKYTLTFTPGSHIVTAIVRDTDTLMAVGSIDEFKVSLVVAEIAAQMFTFSLNGNGESYTVTGLASPIGQFVMPVNRMLEIPSTYEGKPVTMISREAFKDRTDIVGSVVIPDSVMEIQDSAFRNCTSLVKVEISDNSQLETIGDNAFQYCPSLESINIPDGVSTISWYAFTGCASLKSIDIPSGIVEIEEHVFHGCSDLVSIIIPEGVTVIKRGAFAECTSLSEVSLPMTLKTIEDGTYSNDGAFENCTSLKTIIIPNNVTTIGAQAFLGCSTLENINIPNGVTAISEEMFSGCTSLTSIDIPDDVTSIGIEAFKDCSALTNVKIPEGVSSIGYSAFSGCISLENINIPDNITSIGQHTFSGCSALETVEISNNCQLEIIGNGAFKNCSSLTSINIPDGVTEISSDAFLGCSALTNIFISDSVTKNGGDVFQNCPSLSDIYCEPSSRLQGWYSWWLGDCNADVFWGVSRSEYDVIMNNDSVPYDVAEPVVGYDSETVTLSCDTSFAHIYYTLDGSEPDKDKSTLYTEPFRHIGDFTLKAVAYVGNGIYSDVVTKPLSSVGAGGID